MNKAATRPADFWINTASVCRRCPLTGEQEMTLIWSRAWDRQSSISASSSENRSPARDRSLLPSTWLNSWCILGRGSDSSQVLFASEHPAENKYVPDMTCPPGLRGTFGGQEKASALIHWILWGSTQKIITGSLCSPRRFWERFWKRWALMLFGVQIRPGTMKTRHIL